MTTQATGARAPSRAALAYGIGLGVLVVDQLSKLWILHGLKLPDLGSMPVFGPLKLTMVWNQGVSFGLFRGEADWVRWALCAFSLVVAVVLAVWARRAQRPLLAIALGLVMGGAIGNLIDRARLGSVADFIDVQALHFPWVFNVADSGISIGVILLLLDSLRKDQPKDG